VNHIGEKAVFHELKPLDGFHEIERDFWGPFVWAKRRFAVKRPNDDAYYSLELCYYGKNGKLRIEGRGASSREFDLHQGWNTYPIDVSQFKSADLVFALNEAPLVSGDSRELGVMIRRFRPLADSRTAQTVGRALANRVGNEKEFSNGCVVLETRPPKILISLSNQCTMNPQCVYCDRDRTIPLEAKSDFAFTPDTFDEMGDFYQLASGIGDNPRGEPSLSGYLGSILSRTDRDDKLVELATNGQAPNAFSGNMLLGKKLGLYFSIDSATREGYARYRNDGFDLVVRNLGGLCRAKKATYNLPTVLVSFLCMRSNMAEIESFLNLVKDIGVDGVKLGMLDRESFLMNRIETRSGRCFDYSKEILSQDELNDLLDKAKEVARNMGIPVLAAWDFASSGIEDERPLCPEPWKAMQVLSHGIVTCIFARNRPITTWAEQRGKPLEHFLWDVWNGEKYRHIRSALASQTIPEHCAGSTGCPIVRKRLHDGLV
jgi:MoaA/NifB/PqqE/SkfB family radical SAM enzyme